MTDSRIPLLRLVLALLLLCQGARVSAEERFAIGKLDEQRLWVSANGSATITRLESGVLVKFDALHFSSRMHRDDSVFISSVRISAGDGNTNLMYSERLPVKLTLRGIDSAEFESAEEIYLQYPDWHQRDPYFRLDIEVSKDGGVVPMSTTLHELKLPSHFPDRVTSSPIRESPAAMAGWLFYLGGVLVFLAVRHLMRKRHAAGREVGVALVLFIIVWTTAAYPLLLSARTVFWKAVDAELVDSGVKTIPPFGKMLHYQYRPVIKYVYVYEGKRFVGTQIAPTPMRASSLLDTAYAVAEKWDRKRREQQRVQAWVNPFDPEQAVLLRSPPLRAWLLTLAGCAALYIWMRRAAKREAPPDLSNTLYGRLRAMQRRW